MRLSRGREYKLNLGNYEHLQVNAMVTIAGEDLYTPEELEDMDPDDLMQALRDFTERHLEQQLNPELEEAAKLSQAEKSILPEPVVEPPRRTERVKRRSTT